jgi:hypothetical protein
MAALVGCGGSIWTGSAPQGVSLAESFSQTAQSLFPGEKELLKSELMLGLLFDMRALKWSFGLRTPEYLLEDRQPMS